MRSEKLYLQDMVEAAADVARFIAKHSEQSFLADEILQNAVLMKLLIIGEAAAHLSRELRDRYAQVPWADIVAFRNFAAHAYFSVNWKRVWNTATGDVPALGSAVQATLRTEFPQ